MLYEDIWHLFTCKYSTRWYPRVEEHCTLLKWPSQKQWQCSMWTCSPTSLHSFLFGKAKEMVKLCQQCNENTFALNKNYEKWCVSLTLPSVELSQKHVLAVCSPAPFFCMMIQFTVKTYKPMWTWYCLSTVCQCLIFNTGEAGAQTDVFERLPQLAEVAEAKLHHAAAPLLHSTLLVRIPSNSSFYSLQKIYDTW